MSLGKFPSARIAAWFVVLLASGAFAQESPDGGTSTDARVDELQRRLEILSQAVEASQNQSVAPPSSTSTAASSGMAPAAAKVYGVKEGLSIGGYGETILTVPSAQLQNGTVDPIDSMTDTLRAVLYVGYKFTDWLVLDSEFEFEHSGFSDEHPQGEAIVEFVYLDFLLAKALNVRAGQILLPIGLINELHEPPIFLGALRPALEQENGIIPTTWHENGVGIHGELPGQLSYKLYLVDGLNAAAFGSGGDTSGSIGGGRQDGHQAIANKPAVTGRLDWHFAPGMFVGASFYAGDSNQDSSVPLWTTLVEAHGEARLHGFQARAIYVRVTNSPSGVESLGPSSPAFSVGTLQSGGYVEAGYDVLALVPDARQSVIPFARFEHVDTQQAVAPGNYPDPENNRSLLELGANYKPISQVAVKADFDLITNAARTGRNQFNLSLAYLF